MPKRHAVESADSSDGEEEESVSNNFNLTSQNTATTSSSCFCCCGGGTGSGHGGKRPHLEGPPQFNESSWNSSPNSSSNQHFSKSMQDLNKAFQNAVCNVMSKSPTHSLLPLAKDYMLHSQVLLQQFRDGSQTVNAINLPPTTFKSLGKFFDDFETRYVENNQKEKNFDPTSSPLSSKPELPIPNPEPTIIPSFLRGFSFFLPPPPSTPPAVGSSATTPGVNSEKDDEDEEVEEPLKVEVVQVKEDDAVYSKRCKVFGVVDGNPIDKGVGTLYVKKLEGGLHQAVVRAENSLGTVILNILLQKTLPLEKNGKNCIMTVDFQANGKKGVPIFIKVKTEDDALELLEKLREFQQY